MKKFGQQLIHDVNFTFGPELKKHKEVFICSVDYVFERWLQLGNQDKNDYAVMYAIKKLFHKRLSFVEVMR